MAVFDTKAEVKTVFAKKHRKKLPDIYADKLSSGQVESFLFHATDGNALEAYKEFRPDERNFVIASDWVVSHSSEGVTYALELTLTVVGLGGSKLPSVAIPPSSKLWKAIVEYSGIKEVFVKVPYPSEG